MNRSKLLQFLFVLSIVLAVIFGIELIVTDWRSNVLSGIGLWCGLISQLMLAVLMFSEINKEKKNNLFVQAIGKFLLGVILIGLLLFLPAGSLRYWQGWLLMGILFVPMFCAGLVMMLKNPELLRKRLNAREEENEQKMVVKLSGLLFIAAFVVAGLNWRFNWYVLPNWAVWVSAGLFLLCYLLYAEVLRENTYLSRTIEVQENQKVIDTGLYGIVRHPMYMATTVLFLVMPLVLASPFSFLIMLLYIPLIAKRIKNEEKVLEEGLDGYREYKQKVKHKVIPFIW
jgi:protein-S-isoprenylcysteine O-methyltransferase Ste14